MADVFGRVQRITNRGKAWNLQMDNGEWFGFGYDQPVFGEGSEISFDVEYNGRFANVAQGTVEVINMVQGQQQRPRQGGGQRQGGGYQQRQGGGQRGGYQQRQGGGQRPAAGGNDKDQYWKNKERDDKLRQVVIEHQSARNAAIDLVGIALQHDCLPLPAKKADKYDALVAAVDLLTEKFMDDLKPVKGDRPQRPAHQQHNAPDDDDDFDDDTPF